MHQTKKRLRVLTIAACPLPARRGTPIRIFRLADALVAIGVHVDVATYHLGESEPEPSFTLHRIDTVKWYNHMKAGPTYGKIVVDWHLAKKVNKLLEQNDYDIIHAHHFEGLLCALFANRTARIPVVFDVHTLLHSELPSYSLALPFYAKRFIGRLIDTYLPRMATHVVVVSDIIEGKLLTEFGMNSTRVSVVPNGTEIEFIRGGRRDKCPHLLLLYTGNLSAYQDIPLLLEAFALLKHRVPHPILRIATDDDFSAFQDQVSRLGIDKFIEVVSGDMKQLPDHLASATITVNPRRICDGVPQKLINYMGAGCPIVSFEGSARHIVHNENGWIVDEPTASSLARGIDHLLDNPIDARKMGVRAAELVDRHLSWDQSARMIERLSLRLLTNP